jgi:hypothetical protein
MSKKQNSIVCVRCGSIGSTDDVLRPGPPGGTDRWVTQCWICGFEWENPRLRTAS